MTEEARATPVELRDLTVRAGGRLLLEGTSARFEPGKVTLVIGPSGAGKSILLRIIAGGLRRSHPGVDVSGTVLLDGREIPDGRANRSVGVVFQSFALFDELSPLDNVRFARAHRAARAHRPGGRGPRRAATAEPRPHTLDGSAGASPSRAASVSEALDPASLLCELRVPQHVRTSALSGGQQQRLAIARTLAYDPAVILYDEPTSGLDAATATQVAELIRHTHSAHPRTSIIVTHDYESLPPIADVIYLLDPHTRSLKRIERDDWPTLRTRLVRPVAVEEPRGPATLQGRIGTVLTRSLEQTGNFFAATTRVVEEAVKLPWRLLPLWRSPTWGLRYLMHYLGLVAGPSAWLYIAVAGLIAGFVTTHFTFKFLPFRGYTEPLIVEDLLHSMGFALYRILVPVLATILIAARCGAAVASDVGGKAYGQQLSALRSFGARPERYLLTNILYAFLVGTPLLVALGFVVAKYTSLVVFTATHADRGPMFWDLHFHRELLAPGEWLYRGSGWLLAKVLTCAAGTALIAYHTGARPKLSSRDISRGITTSILWSTLYVLVVHFAFTFVEFE